MFAKQILATGNINKINDNNYQCMHGHLYIVAASGGSESKFMPWQSEGVWGFSHRKFLHL